MAQVYNARVENMVYALKELQNEKVCLEQKLQELAFKGRDLEQNFEQETAKCAHVQEKHRRMAGTFAVAEQKVDTTMSSCLSLQECIDKRKPEHHRNQQSIENEKKTQHENINKFETSLSSISKELFHARDFYKKQALKNEINNAKKPYKDLELKAEKDERELERMKSKLESLTKEKGKSATSTHGCEGELYLCYRALERDRQEAEEYRNRVKAELKEIRDVLNEGN